MASGKTAVGRRLSVRLGRPFVDLDELIERREGRTIERIFADEGEEAFRRIERETLSGLAFDRPSVIATGGGTFIDADNRRVLSELGVVVCLAVGFDTILQRVARKSTRPLAKGPDAAARLRSLWVQRMDAYRKADILVEIDDLSIDQSVTRVVASLEPRLRKPAGGTGSL